MQLIDNAKLSEAIRDNVEAFASAGDSEGIYGAALAYTVEEPFNVEDVHIPAGHYLREIEGKTAFLYRAQSASEAQEHVDLMEANYA